MVGFLGVVRPSCLWFDLSLQNFYPSWKGKLVVHWPPPERSWWRRAHKNEISVHAILEDSALDTAIIKWDQLDFTWAQLGVLPKRWEAKLAEWRGIYYIFDASDGKGYVGSAYGPSNLLGRWRQYAASGHGGNRLLRRRDHNNFRFTILEFGFSKHGSRRCDSTGEHPEGAAAHACTFRTERQLTRLTEHTLAGGWGVAAV